MLISAQIFPYNQEIFYNKLHKIIEQLTNKTDENTIKKEKKALIHANNYNKLETECLNKRKACFIAILDGRENEEIKKTFDKNIEVLNALVNDKDEKPFTYLWLNATCHSDLLLEFGVSVDSIPNALVYVPSKEVYTTMIGTFDKSSIDTFLGRAIQGKISMQSANKDKFKFKDVDCSLLKEEAIVEADDDDIMKEMMEEIRRKEEEEKIAKEQVKPKKKKGKKNKKKSKSDL